MHKRDPSITPGKVRYITVSKKKNPGNLAVFFSKACPYQQQRNHKRDNNHRCIPRTQDQWCKQRFQEPAPEPDSLDSRWCRDGDEQATSGNFRQFVLSIPNPEFENKKLWIQNNDILIKFVWIRLINFDILVRSRFCISFQQTGFGFNIHSVCLQPHGFRIRILKSRSGFGLIN